jgi:hydroxyacylglutathione hydrolase
MKVTKHVHALKVPFPAAGRFVYVYFIFGPKICVVDGGIAPATEAILDEIRKAGRDLKEISWLVQTHSHGDHIGASARIQEVSGCKVAAHPEEVSFMEDLEVQYRNRPTPTFYTFVQKPVKVDRRVQEGDSIDFADGQTLQVIHTPGHSPGSISFYYLEDQALFSGDAIPLAGGLPIYSEISTTVQSVLKLKAFPGIQALFSSWHEPQLGQKAYQTMDDALAYMQKIHDLVRREKANAPALASREMSLRILKNLGLPESMLSPNVIATIEAHMRESHKAKIAG